jgi:adenosylhomocysteine nucleosidase
MNMETIGLIAAVPHESAALLRCIQEWKYTALGPFRGARFEFMGRECVLVTTGMGLTRAMEGTRALLAATNPQVLVSFGIAGAVNADLRIGDVVVARHACWMDKGKPGSIRPLASLSKQAWEAAAQALQMDGARLLAGTALTTRGSQVVLELPQEMTHPVLEMETSGIAQVASEMGIPLVSIRSISDGPQAPIPFDLEAILDESYNLRKGKMLGIVLRNPKILLQSRRMRRNSRIAADHAARALVAALSQPSPVISS